MGISKKDFKRFFRSKSFLLMPLPVVSAANQSW